MFNSPLRSLSARAPNILCRQPLSAGVVLCPEGGPVLQFGFSGNETGNHAFRAEQRFFKSIFRSSASAGMPLILSWRVCLASLGSTFICSSTSRISSARRPVATSLRIPRMFSSSSLCFGTGGGDHNQKIVFDDALTGNILSRARISRQAARSLRSRQHFWHCGERWRIFSQALLRAE